MTIVLISWYLLKHSLAPDRQTPYQRGIYEDMFYKMADSYPQLWARSGPREAIKPRTRLDRIRWHLILLWNDPDKTTRKTPGDDTGYDDLGAWARCKRYLTSRWTKQLRTFDDIGSSSTVLEDGYQNDDISFFDEKVDANEVEVKSTHSAPAAQDQENRLEVPTSTNTPSMAYMMRSKISGSRPGSRPSSAPVHGSDGRRSHSSGRTSGILVEEEPAGWLKDYNRPRGSNPIFY